MAKRLSKEEKKQYRQAKRAKAWITLKQNLVIWALKGLGLLVAAAWLINLIIDDIILGQAPKTVISIFGAVGLFAVLGLIIYRTIKMKLQAKIIASEVASELNAVGKNPLWGLLARVIFIMAPVVILSFLSYGIATFTGSFALLLMKMLVAAVGIIPYAMGEYISWEYRKQNKYVDQLENNEAIVDALEEKLKGYTTK